MRSTGLQPGSRAPSRPAPGTTVQTHPRRRADIHRKLLLRSLPRRRARILWLVPSACAQRLVLNEIPVNVQETDRLVFERRAAAIVAEVDRRTLVDRVDDAERVSLVTAIQVHNVDSVLDAVVAEEPEAVAQGRGAEQRHHQVRAGRYTPGGQRRTEAGLLVRELEFRGQIEQAAGADRTVDDEPAEAARPTPETPLQHVVNRAGDFGE